MLPIDRVKDRRPWEGMGDEPIRVAELFAGVGGFRLGLEGHPESEEDTGFRIVFSNQFEPGEKAQWASRIYEERFGSEGHSGKSIHEFTFPKDGVADIPEHDLLVGGFPCQDYSVARTVSGELGIEGEKGKLWVDIARIIRHKRPRPKVVLLENVPRLLNSPANARGLNFAIILNELLSMGYQVEWRVINAADYGMPQQRSRVFILAYRAALQGLQVKINGPGDYGFNGQVGRVPKSRNGMTKWLLGKSTTKTSEKWETGPFATAFPVKGDFNDSFTEIPQDIETYSYKSSPFENAGYAWQRQVVIDGVGGPRKNVFWSTRVKPDYEGDKILLCDSLDEELDPEYEVDTSRIDEWRYAKGSKNEFRLRKRDRENVGPELVELYDECMSAPFGERAEKWKEHRQKFLKEVGEDKFYQYDEGAMRFDSPDRPSRTVVTDEIGRTPSRMRHIIEYEEGRYRRLSPEETERLNGFPAGWTDIEGIKPSRSGFLMGNALVVGIIERLRGPLRNLINSRGLE